MSDGILSRWARRKEAVRAAERAVAQPTKPENRPSASVDEDGLERPVEASPEEADALAEAIASLPRIEDLTAETDLAPFLRAGIPSMLRNAALRRMWSVDPAIRDFVSEAREYAYDWNTPGGVPGLGPMLPTDDVKAMVERIMSGHAPAPQADEPAGLEPEAVAEALTAGETPEIAPISAPDYVDSPFLIRRPSRPRLINRPQLSRACDAMAGRCPAKSRERDCAQRKRFLSWIQTSRSLAVIGPMDPGSRSGMRSVAPFSEPSANGGAGLSASIDLNIPMTVPVDDVDQLRAQQYDLLAVLLGRPPGSALLAALALLKGGDSVLGREVAALGQAAVAASPDAVTREYFDLFVGSGAANCCPTPPTT